MAEEDMPNRPPRPHPAVASGPAKSDLPLGDWISKAIDQARESRNEQEPREKSASERAPARGAEDPATPALDAEARDAAARAAESSGLSVAEWIGRAVQDAALTEGGVEAETDQAGNAQANNAKPAEADDPFGAEAMSAARRAADSSGQSLNQWISDVIHDAEEDDGSAPNPDPPAADRPAADEDDSMRQAASRAAAAAGLPLGAWLRSAVEEASAGPGGSDDPVSGDQAPAGAPPERPAEPAAPPTAHRAETRPETPAETPPRGGHQDITRLARYLPLDALEPGPFQAREDMNPAEIVTLSESIRDKGVLQPILVRRQRGREDRYHVIAGERRWRASRMAGLSEVPTIVLDISDREAMQIALVENLVRRDLNPIEEAQGFRRLIDEYAHTQDELAELVGRSRSHVANMLRLLRLPEDVQSLLREGELSASQGRALVNAPDPSDLARQVIERDLNVRQTEALVQRNLGETKDPEPPATTKDLDATEKSLSARLGMRVRISMRGDRGTLSVRFKGQEGLDALLARLEEKQ